MIFDSSHAKFNQACTAFEAGDLHGIGPAVNSLGGHAFVGLDSGVRYERPTDVRLGIISKCRTWLDAEPFAGRHPVRAVKASCSIQGSSCACHHEGMPPVAVATLRATDCLNSTSRMTQSTNLTWSAA